MSETFYIDYACVGGNSANNVRGIQAHLNLVCAAWIIGQFFDVVSLSHLLFPT